MDIGVFFFTSGESGRSSHCCQESRRPRFCLNLGTGTSGASGSHNCRLSGRSRSAYPKKRLGLSRTRLLLWLGHRQQPQRSSLGREFVLFQNAIPYCWPKRLPLSIITLVAGFCLALARVGKKKRPRSWVGTFRAAGPKPATLSWP